MHIKYIFKEGYMISSENIAIVKSTAPILAQTGPALTAHFYERMFNHHPELKDVFNMSNQRNGNQREALFAAICAYANNIDNLEALLPAVEKIAQKHTSFLITAEQYQIVGEHLLATIDEMLAPGEAVLNAWAAAYGVLADIFINRETQIYQENAQKEGGWQGLRPFTVIEKNVTSKFITSFVFKPADGGKVMTYKPGQYLGINIQSDKFDNHEIRQYSLSSAPQSDRYQISVKREQYGKVSNYLHDDVNVGDTVMLLPPAGDFFLNVSASTPVTLISAGVGFTPMMAMLKTLTKHPMPINWLHATENGEQHSYRAEIKKLQSDYPQLNSHIWYNQPLSSDVQGQDFDDAGLMYLDAVQEQLLQPDMQFYLCGPVPFMQFVAKQLIQMGIATDRINYECFGPNKVLLA